MKVFCHFGKISIRVNIGSQFISVYFPWPRLGNPTVNLTFSLLKIQPTI